MARIRTIKPKFWDDSKIGKLTRDARLLYIGLWTFSDDIGVVIGDAIWLKSKIFPYDQIQIQQFDKWITELVTNGFICLLSYKGERFIYLPNFTRHQVINRPNVEDLNIPKELIESNKDKITEQSLINHGIITELSLPIKGEGKGGKETSSNEEAKKARLSLEAKEKELRNLESLLKEKEEELAQREAALLAGQTKKQPSLDFVADNFKSIFQTWLDYKRERRESYKSAKSLTTCYNKLLDLSCNDPETARLIVEQSMAYNWAGLFPLKQEQHEQRRLQPQQTKPEEHSSAQPRPEAPKDYSGSF